MKPVTKTFRYGTHQVTFETGEIARQANGAVVCAMGDTVVLVTVVAQREPMGGCRFLPLTVNYQERRYATGKIPGGSSRREGQPSEHETLTARLIDRPVRPLLPAGFNHEVQIVATVMSLDPAVDPNIPALLGASAALAVSGIPFSGPLGAARVGYRDGQYVLNPSTQELGSSTLDLVVAGTKQSVLMVESEARKLSEEVMLGAILFGHQQMQPAIRAVEQLAQAASVTRWNWQPPKDSAELASAVFEACKSDLIDAYEIRDKQRRDKKLARLRRSAVDQLSGRDSPPWSPPEVEAMITKLEKH
jgi:polyribonucleotide nucleotidyltransferase